MATRDSASPGDRLAELLARYHLGHYANRPAVQRRLADLFAASPTPPGTLDRLLTACEHLGVSGLEAAELVAAAHAHGPAPATEHPAEAPKPPPVATGVGGTRAPRPPNAVPHANRAPL